MNEQKPMRLDRREDGFLYVHSIFATIQGEGPYAGWPAVFVRLTGCNLQCPWCDTEYSEVFLFGPPIEVVEDIRCNFGKYRLVVITGGEPFRQNITPLVIELRRYGYHVQVETNGVLYPGDDFPWDDVTVVCSPKTPQIHPKTARMVHAYKYVLENGRISDLGFPTEALGLKHDKETVAVPPTRFTGRIYLQPMDAKNEWENEKNLEAVAHTVMRHPGKFIMGVQMHKIANLP